MISAKRAFDHVGMAVPDIDRAVDFFVDALGFDIVVTMGPYDDFGYTWPGDIGPEKGTLRQANLVLGDSFNLELLEYSDRRVATPDRAPRPADPGGWHLALHVDDIHAARQELLERSDIEPLSEVICEEGDLEGLQWAYFRTDWGLVLEFIQWRPGMPYEGHTRRGSRCRNGRRQGPLHEIDGCFLFAFHPLSCPSLGQFLGLEEVRLRASSTTDY